MDHVTYTELVERFGRTQAHDLLLTLEKTAKVKANTVYQDEQTRLQRVMAALNAQADDKA
jgi:hypothetical protein